MASKANTYAISVFVDDVDANLEASARSASSIDRELTERVALQKRLGAGQFHTNLRELYTLLSVSTTVVEETRRLRENLRAAREAMADLRRELAKSRRA